MDLSLQKEKKEGKRVLCIKAAQRPIAFCKSIKPSKKLDAFEVTCYYSFLPITFSASNYHGLNCPHH